MTKIRKMTSQDVLDIATLIKRFELDDGNTRKTIDYLFNIVDSRPVQLGEERAEMFVFIHDKKIVGICGFYQAFADPSNTYWVNYFAVEKKYQGEGFGKQLFRYVERIIRKEGAKRFLVYTSSSLLDERAGRFYRKQGFVEFGRIKDLWGNGHDKVYMQKLYGE